MDECWPGLWEAGGKSVVGFSHICYRIPNQDAIAWFPRDQSAEVVVAVADGHGAPAHFRSAVGARLAVEVALRVLGASFAKLRNAPSPDLPALAASLVSEWRADVRAHLSSRPLSQSEQAFGLSLDEFTPYGTTLIAAAAGRMGLLVLQIGDGDLLIGNTAGDLYRPLPDDVGLTGEQTYSLCQPDAASYMRAQWIDAQSDVINFVMLSTDGLSKSFRDGRLFHKLGQVWRERIAREGLAAATVGLDDQLSNISREGSGDDITVGFLIGATAANDARLSA